MKPQGNRVGIWTDRNARPQRTIGSEEEAKAESCCGLLLESADAKRVGKARKPNYGKNL